MPVHRRAAKSVNLKILAKVLQRILERRSWNLYPCPSVTQMPPSQLKRLKVSLREQGITGQQKSKKSKKRSNAPSAEQRIRRGAALASIRESFNPFEVKQPTRPNKFGVTSNKTIAGNNGAVVYGRPGVTKSVGEEQRRKTLLPELHRRNKAGGILDRRIGENDPSMTPDERMLERFTREKQRKKGNVFDLEEDTIEDELTHMGRSLEMNPNGVEAENFDEHTSDASDNEDQQSDEDDSRGRKRSFEDLKEQVDEGPEWKKTKAEVMKEVIAKSKLHKYERQQAKEDDDDIREELDKGLPDLMSVLLRQNVSTSAINRATEPHNTSKINPERAEIINGADRATVEKQYDSRLRQMALDKRSQPTERTKTEEEKIAEEAKRLQELEQKRLRRMRGESVSEEDEDDGQDTRSAHSAAIEIEEEADDAAVFGFTSTSDPKGTIGVEDEDDFIIDEDLVGSGSDVDSATSLAGDESESEQSDSKEVIGDEGDEDDDELISGLLSKEEQDMLRDRTRKRGDASAELKELAFTYPCPQSREELFEVFRDVSVSNIPVVIQRIRALYHPQIQAGNKEKLGDFSAALVAYLTHTGAKGSQIPLFITEIVIRHIHSLSRTFPEIIGNAFREHLRALHATNNISPGYLVVLTAIGSIYPTSDHFHQVVTPAITIMARWLGLTNPSSKEQFITGACLSALCVKYQQLSKRYIPELVRFSLLALRSTACSADVKSSHLTNLNTAMELWADKLAFIEIFTPAALDALSHLDHPNASQLLKRLRILLAQSRLSRRPLELHHHRPLPIKTSIPKFEESFNPDRHYDPDRERAEAGKLRAEYKREKKGALRELRKDANFLARQQLREKKEKDRAYEEKFRKLVAEIQGEEGHEKNEYERAKRARKRGR